MKKVTYAGQSFVTTDIVAATLFSYIAAMDRYGAGESVDIPILNSHGEEDTATLLVWAGSEVIALPELRDDPDPTFNVKEMHRTASKREGYRRAESPAETEYDQTGVIDSL